MAASVNYYNSTVGSCSTIGGRAKCMFDASNSNSAVSKLCARKNVDCSRGIVVSGFSQGSIISLLAKNYDSRVQAPYAMGAGVQFVL